MGFPGGIVVKNQPANAGDSGNSGSILEDLEGDLEDPKEKGMATHSSILARKIPWREEPGRLQSMGSQRVKYN